jgi:hypothetical protein
MPTLRDLSKLSAYQALLKNPGRQTFTQLLRLTKKTNHVLSNQLRLLEAAEMISRREATNPSDRRSTCTYGINPVWPWMETHKKVMDDVAKAIAESRVILPLSAGAQDPGVDDILVYTNLIVESDPGKAESYPPGTVNREAIETVVKALREILKREDPQGYGWQKLLRRLIAEVVTWQPRSFFMLSYPASCFGSGSAGHTWPDPNWQEHRLRSFSIPRPSQRARVFLLKHGYLLEALSVVNRWPRVSTTTWEERLHGPEYGLGWTYCQGATRDRAEA